LPRTEFPRGDNDPAVPAVRVYRNAQSALGLDQVLENVPEDDDFGAVGRHVERLTPSPRGDRRMRVAVRPRWDGAGVPV